MQHGFDRDRFVLQSAVRPACSVESGKTQVLEDYELTRRLEEEEVEYAVASLDDINGNGQVGTILKVLARKTEVSCILSTSTIETLQQFHPESTRAR